MPQDQLPGAQLSTAEWRRRLNLASGTIIRAFGLAVFLCAAIGDVAQAAQPPSLKTVPIPRPSNLERFVVDEAAAAQLGKALFWDMQAGSDGVQACASCHFHAGADSRMTNQLSPGLNAGDVTFEVGPPNHTLTAADFPFHELANPLDRLSAVVFDSNDVSGSMGVFASAFNAVVPGSDVDDCSEVFDPIYNVGGKVVRRATGRNTPTAINAVFNFRNFWDGRASFMFNGVNPVGARDPNARILEVQLSGSVAPVAVVIDRGALASQAVGPPNSSFEMACAGRTFPDLGRKMLSLVPLGKQLVAPTDSVLGTLSSSALVPGTPGLATSYAALIEQAFDPAYWDSDDVVSFDASGQHVLAPPSGPLGSGQYTMMEANFSLFWGLAIQLYETLLVSDDSAFDRLMDDPVANANALTPAALRGLSVFTTSGECGACHVGAEMSGATVNNIGAVEIGEPRIREFLVEFMTMGDLGNAFYDFGFYNVGVRPTAEDLGIGGEADGPICVARRSKLGLPTPEQDYLGEQVTVPPESRVACDGAFKTPILRNLELTAPYFHNGGKLTLEQVVEFYNHGGDFREQNIDNVDGDIPLLGLFLSAQQRSDLVEFLKSLTDERVRFERAPFDHPELLVPVEQEIPPGPGPQRANDVFMALPPVGAEGHCIGIDGMPGTGPAIFTSSCDDFDACTTDVCDPIAGCLHESVVCEDNNACTADSCDTLTGCVNAAAPCSDGNVCTVDTCDPLTGVCSMTALLCENGFPCSGPVCAATCGDLSANGVVGISDAMLAAQYTTGLQTCQEISFYTVCDIAPAIPDGRCTITDALRVAQCAVGLISCDFECNALPCAAP